MQSNEHPRDAMENTMMPRHELIEKGMVFDNNVALPSSGPDLSSVYAPEPADSSPPEPPMASDSD
jgi:hypothetical protein